MCNTRKYTFFPPFPSKSAKIYFPRVYIARKWFGSRAKTPQMGEPPDLAPNWSPVNRDDNRKPLWMTLTPRLGNSGPSTIVKPEEPILCETQPFFIKNSKMCGKLHHFITFPTRKCHTSWVFAAFLRLMICEMHEILPFSIFCPKISNMLLFRTPFCRKGPQKGGSPRFGPNLVPRQ